MSEDARKSYQIVLENIQRQIMNGQYRAGDRLPPERKISETYSVSRNSVREAMRSLEVLGLVECRHGGGNFIANRLDGYLVNGLSVLFALNRGKAAELLQMRRAIELESVRNIIERRDPGDAAALRALLDRYLASADEAARLELDEELHRTIVRLSGNGFYRLIFDMLSSLILPYLRKMASLSVEYEGGESLSREHADLVRAVEAGDLALADQVLSKHLFLDKSAHEACRASTEMELTLLNKLLLK